jgi:adenosylmethionine---8-amino-7-oxononanoate aminotransferase
MPLCGNPYWKNMFQTNSSLIELDKRYIWHPYTQAATAGDPIPIVRGKGAYLYSESGERYIDAISSWWVNLHGHSHPYIAGKIAEQAQVLEHVIFADFTHKPALELAERLLRILPGNLSKVFYTDNGSTAVEAALKMALQYWHNQNPETKKTKIISFKYGYHGDTFGAMAAAGKNHFNQPFWPFLFEVATIEPPVKGKEELSLNQLQFHLEQNDCACFIFEPLVQGAGGMIMHSSQGLDPLIKMCQDYSVLTIADEVMTGFGRTGSFFACDALEYTPDIICLSKGITGGFLPLGATVCTNKIFDFFLSPDKEKALLHGHSYTANPLACAAALASLDLLEIDACAKQRDKIHACHINFKNSLSNYSRVQRCEVSGTILVLEYQTAAGSSYFNGLKDKLYRYFLSKHILLRPLGNILYILPPYCISEEDLQEIYEAILPTLEEDFYV